MFRERPLTWLFLLATFVVDLAMSFGERGPAFQGIAVGQVAAVAIWAVISQSHRLTRGSLLVMAVGFLAILLGPQPFNFYSLSLTFMATYAMVAVVTSLVVVWLRNQVRIRFDENREKAPLKIPLIEFFGWTIVVAIASFGARYVDLEVLESMLEEPFLALQIYTVAPLALILFDSRYRPLHLVKAVLFVGGVYRTAFSIKNDWEYAFQMTSLSAYLTAWLLVRSIEFDQLKTAEEDAVKIRLFDADE